MTPGAGRAVFSFHSRAEENCPTEILKKLMKTLLRSGSVSRSACLVALHRSYIIILARTLSYLSLA